MEQLTGITNVFYPEDNARGKKNKQYGSACWERCRLGPTYHSYHLQVLQIRSLCGQQLLGNEVGPICWKPLQRHHNRERTLSMDPRPYEQKSKYLSEQPIHPAMGKSNSARCLIGCFTRPTYYSSKFTGKFSASVQLEVVVFFSGRDLGPLLRGTQTAQTFLRTSSSSSVRTLPAS